jgi:hypothetical protein
MTELTYFLIVNATVLAHAIPDFIVWFFFAKENPAWKWAKTFRISKFIYDFPVTFAVLFWIIGLPLDIIGWFYMIKWAHGADSEYNIFSFIFKKPVPNKKAYWRWWVFPYIFKSKFLYHEMLANWVIRISIIKARVDRNQAWYASIGMEIAFIIYLVIRYWVN